MRALRKRYGRAGGGLKWESMPGVTTQSFAMTRDGAIYTVTFDSRKRKWVLLDSRGFVGSAIRKRDAQRLAEGHVRR